jgi:hypothetical protein
MSGVLLGLVAALAACGSGSSKGPESGESDWVVQSKFDEAYAVVQKVDYLPFNYKVDGCYARALYMSMELAVNKMESDSVFAFAQQGTVLTVGQIQWGYHVAPMLEVGDSQNNLVHMIIDPSLAKKPLSQDEWVQIMGYAPDASDHPQMLVVAGSEYAPREALSAKPGDVPSFKAMPPFKETDIQSACGVMFNYIALEPGQDNAATTEKQQKLISRTGELVDGLRAVGKVKGNAAFDSEACASGR